MSTGNSNIATITPTTTTNESTKTITSAANSKSATMTSVMTVLLATLFAASGLLYTLQSVYQEFYLPLMQRSTRTDEQLHEEFTYYHRRCTERDVTTQDLTDLLLSDENPENVQSGVDMLMAHGAVVVPNVLSLDTVQQLREYAVFRNRVIPEHEKYPVSQGHNRISFGYDATEHPAVVRAVQQVARNPQIQQLLVQVLGDFDPASTEITTITQYYGAPEQAWHSDTKEDGNALKFARTYSHSYSLFLPLQNTTKAMGATELCPGTHYCSNDLHQVCDRVGQGLQAAHPEDGIFRAGDGVLLNQHVWHRGAAHQDPHASERVVLIMSFIARPKRLDTRQLSRGTYFHQKWNMWGHTWRDLQDPVRYMSAPFSHLKCLGLFSRSGADHWGYDLVTATYMRFSNGQLGNDLTRLVDIWDHVLRWPTWLRGPNLEYQVEEQAAWQHFIQGTMTNVSQWVNRIALTLHAAYLLGIVVLAMFVSQRKGQPKPLLATAKRILMTHGLVACLLYGIWYKIRSSQWGQDVVHGRVLMRPFPPVSIATEEELQLLPGGPTTYPSTWDVLVGTRFDAAWLGSYERWLNGHPGNARFRQLVQHYAPFYQSGLTPALARTVVDFVIAEMEQEKEGRFVQQDYRTGDWRVQTREETLATVELELACEASSLLAALRTTLDRTIAIYRFGTPLRTTALSRKSAVYLWKLKYQLAGFSVIVAQPKKALPNAAIDVKVPGPFRLPKLAPPLLRNTTVRFNKLDARSSNIPALARKSQSTFRVGLPVWIHLRHIVYGESEETWHRGDILDSNDKDGTVNVALEDGTIQSHVPVASLAKYKPLQEGDQVFGCFSYEAYMIELEENPEEEMYDPPLLEDCYPGEVIRVMPDGAASIVYEDGDFEFRKPFGHYYVPPYASAS